ncbi:hypothetical protein FHS15_002185 [Paenibacillus castaneae]|uniref:hypothetical protein n=1 Tax=Paenibacillus castaneae TaxID=474957 RepID=UPI000C99E7C2|nr:hypothetical protein [Paenibacillus castaneae]NIK77060.1 hypothetical protein [Paenibacillus castaneae]
MEIKEASKSTHLTESNNSLQQHEVNPNFSKFDSETMEEKEAAYHKFLAAQKIREKIYGFLRPILIAISLLIGIALLFGIVIALSGIPHTMNKEFTAIQYRTSDPAYVENTTIIVKGKLYKRFFTNPKFVGSIVVDNFEYTKTHQLFDITFYKYDQSSSDVLMYYTNKQGVPVHEPLGVMMMSENFNTLSILVFEPLDKNTNSKSTMDLIISAPAASRKEAVQIYEQLSPRIVQ